MSICLQSYHGMLSSPDLKLDDIPAWCFANQCGAHVAVLDHERTPLADHGWTSQVSVCSSGWLETPIFWANLSFWKSKTTSLRPPCRGCQHFEDCWSDREQPHGSLATCCHQSQVDLYIIIPQVYIMWSKTSSFYSKSNILMLKLLKLAY